MTWQDSWRLAGRSIWRDILREPRSPVTNNDRRWPLSMRHKITSYRACRREKMPRAQFTSAKVYLSKVTSEMPAFSSWLIAYGWQRQTKGPPWTRTASGGVRSARDPTRPYNTGSQMNRDVEGDARFLKQRGCDAPSSFNLLVKPWRPKGFSILNHHKCLS